MQSTADNLIKAGRRLSARLQHIKFNPPVSFVYNPLEYAWKAHESYLRKYGNSRKRVLFLGMNPGPFGMVQTGVPFGEVAAVRDWLKINATIGKPEREHPRRLVLGLDCPRSEISGLRLWGLFAKRFVSADEFFADHFVLNYCPLAFVEASGRNRTPDKLARAELARVVQACDQHLKKVVEILEPEWLIGIGNFAEQRTRSVFPNHRLKIERILHPSPANPAANRNWEAIATEQLEAFGVWSKRMAVSSGE